MKLRNKLFINLGIIIFITVNLFSYYLIHSIFNMTIKETVASSFDEYSVIFSNLKVGESLRNLFLTSEEILKIKSTEYLNNQKNNELEFQFRDKHNDLIYTSASKALEFNEDILNGSSEEANYMIYDGYQGHKIIINSLIEINGTEFNFTYIKDISRAYQGRLDSFKKIIYINILLGSIMIIVLCFITFQITKPIELLIQNIEQIIKGNYNRKLDYSSNIKEFQEISLNFNLMNDEIQNKIADLQNQNYVKQRFIDNLTHEIRTPLTSIIGYSSLLLNKDVNDIDVIRKSLDVINKDGKRILSLTSNLIKLITLNKNELVVENISVVSVLKEIENTFSIKIKDLNINFSVIGDDFDLKIDKSLFIILISNFVDNAIKAVQGTEKKSVQVLLQPDKITIKDTGIGISKKNINKIFEPFYMIDKSRSKSLNGFGLGLSICKEIINIFDIDFSVKSEIGEGTEIILIFPKETDI